jgi:hypothetical protein
MGPRTDLEAVVKRKIPSPCGDSKPPLIQPRAIPLSYPGYSFTVVLSLLYYCFIC